MEEIYLLIEERFTWLDELNGKLSRITEGRDSTSGGTILKPSEVAEFTHQI
jgi:hypothetical protein